MVLFETSTMIYILIWQCVNAEYYKLEDINTNNAEFSRINHFKTKISCILHCRHKGLACIFKNKACYVMKKIEEYDDQRDMNHETSEVTLYKEVNLPYTFFGVINITERNTIATLPKLETEFNIVFEFKLMASPQGLDASLMLIRVKGGQQIFSIKYIHRDNQLKISSAHFPNVVIKLQILSDTWNQMEISQRKNKNNVYTYSIKVNRNEEYQAINENPMMFNDVLIKVSGRFSNQSPNPGFVRYLVIISG